MKRLRSAIIALSASAALLLPGTASALTYSPPTFDLVAKPGQVVQETLHLRNESPTPVTLTASTANFAGKADDDALGIPDFYPAEEVRDGRGLAPWISFPKRELTLLAGERAELAFTVAVPKNAGPGSYFGAVVLATAAGETAENVGVTGSAAALVLLRVEGDVIENLRLNSFSAPLLSSSLPVRFEASVMNGGTVHLRPYGEVTVKNALGREVATLAMNRLEYKSVLPGMARRYATTWQRKNVGDDASLLARQWQNFAFGRYTAEMKLRYGQDERLMIASTSFWVIPWLTLLILLGGVSALFWGLRSLLRWYADRVIRRHEKGT
ncbi:MAG: hypothetical protein QY323_04140 [Patescibacteria group bacterium]|nr:MAG: hypothetical protein QY323_04140 [Patescibacteria group bacterium]